jgi:hypothetical protein
MQRKPKDSDEVGRKHEQGEVSQPTGSERARDEQREDGGPRYGGEAWTVADERGDNRFGKARNDDADPLEQMKRGQEDEEVEAQASAPAEGQDRRDANEEDDVTFRDLQNAAGSEGGTHVESGGQMAGIGRGEKPRKPKSRAKK